MLISESPLHRMSIARSALAGRQSMYMFLYYKSQKMEINTAFLASQQLRKDMQTALRYRLRCNKCGLMKT